MNFMSVDYCLRLKTVRSYLKKKELSALIVSTGDCHASEYPPEHEKLRHYLCPFSGSAGTLIITQNSAALWTDFRYWQQAERQLEGSGVTLMKDGQDATPKIEDWLESQVKRDTYVGINSSCVTWKEFEQLSDKLAQRSITLTHVADCAQQLWPDRPTSSTTPVFLFDNAQSPVTQKVAKLRATMKALKVSAHFVSHLDAIAWLLNLRGHDILYTPVFLSFLWVDARNVILFIDKQKLAPEVKAVCKANAVTIMPYDSVPAFLREVTPSETVLLDKNKTSAAFIDAFQNAHTVNATSPIDTMKVIKSHAELEALRQTMVSDGVALTELFTWLGDRISNEIPTTEYDVSCKLLELRRQSEFFIEPSFETIAAFGPNAAECHYAPSNQNSRLIERGNMLLIDSGGQYTGGTTDVTRTIAIGEVTCEMKRDFTAVLRGHIALALAVFPDGVYASQLDTLTRIPLWEIGADFGHSTGHGVGFALGVHEGPVYISPRAKCLPENRIHPGIVLSNEPGLYRNGQWGIRTENLVTPIFSDQYGYLTFETLTLAPIDTRLINTAMMNPVEINWVNFYNRVVYERLKDHLSPKALAWLKKATEPV